MNPYDDDTTSVGGAATVAADDEAGADEPDTVEDIDLYRAWKTCREMLTERGYKIHDDVVDSSFEGFKLMMNLKENMDGPDADPLKQDYILVRGFNEKKEIKNIVVKLIRQNTPINKTYLRKESEQYDDDDDDEDDDEVEDDDMDGGGAGGKDKSKKKKNTTTIFVITAKPTKIIIAADYELFRYSEVIFNRTRHRLVPKHELMSKADKAAVLAMYDCKESQIPRMLKSDFMARYYGAKSGDMFKIYRPSPSCGTYTTYRMVK